MITLSLSYIALGWIALILAVTLVENVFDDAGASLHDLIVIVFLLIPSIVLVISTFVWIYLWIAELLQLFVIIA